MKLNDLMDAYGNDDILVTVYDANTKEYISNSVERREMMDSEEYKKIAGRTVCAIRFYVTSDGNEMWVSLY